MHVSIDKRVKKGGTSGSSRQVASLFAAACVFALHVTGVNAKVRIPPNEVGKPFTRCMFGTYSKKYLCEKSPKMSAEMTEEIDTFTNDNSTLCSVLKSKPIMLMGDSVMEELWDVTSCLCPGFISNKVITTKGIDVQTVFRNKVARKMTNDHVLVLNFGIWFNPKMARQLQIHTRGMAKSLADMKEKMPGVRIVWVDSVAQHFCTARRLQVISLNPASISAPDSLVYTVSKAPFTANVWPAV